MKRHIQRKYKFDSGTAHNVEVLTTVIRLEAHVNKVLQRYENISGAGIV
jgi:hypothetical protein